MKLTIDRHDASHGLSATAELLVPIVLEPCTFGDDLRCTRMALLLFKGQRGKNNMQLVAGNSYFYNKYYNI